MSLVRFATLCDSCGARSEEYTGWPTCTDCGEDTCPSCMEPGSKTDADLDTPETCLCETCALLGRVAGAFYWGRRYE